MPDTAAPQGVEIRAPHNPAYDAILTPEALAFVVGLAWRVLKLALILAIGWLAYSYVRDRARPAAR